MEEMSASDWLAVVRWDGELEVYQDFTQETQALVEAISRADAARLRPKASSANQP